MGKHHYHKRKKPFYKKGSFWIIVLVLLLVFVYANPSSLGNLQEKITKLKTNIPSEIVQEKNMELGNRATTITNFKDMTQNPESYVDKELRVRGKLKQGFYPMLYDSEDYWIYLDRDKCKEIQREYTSGKIYSAQGIFRKVPQVFEGHFKFILECTTPLN